MRKETTAKDSKIADLSSQVAKQERKIQSLEAKLAEKEDAISEFEGVQSDAEALREELDSAKTKITDSLKLQTNLDSFINDLRLSSPLTKTNSFSDFNLILDCLCDCLSHSILFPYIYIIL